MLTKQCDMNHVEAFENALSKQFQLKKPNDHAARISDHCKSKQGKYETMFWLWFYISQYNQQVICLPSIGQIIS